MVDLLLTQLGITIEVLECVVDDREDLLAISLLENLIAGELLDMQIISLLYHLGNLGVFLWHFIWHIHLIFDIVVVLFPTTHFLHVLRIIRIVVYCGLRTELVESPSEHTLGIHICESKRAYNFFHAMLPTPFLNGGKKGL